MSTISIHPTYRPALRPAERETPGELRLTRRGRLVVLLAGVLVMFALAVWAGAGSVATQERGEPMLTEVHTVAQGETLWQIADEIDDSGRTAEMVDTIEQMNGLETASLTIGQELRVPVGH